LEPKGPPRIVTAKVLATDHVSDRDAAKLAYHGQTLQVSVTGYIVTEKEIHWVIFYDGKPRKPVIVFQFDAPLEKIKGSLLIEGHCTGCTDDKEDRGFPGYTFTVTLTHCRIVPPPARPVP